MVSVASKNLLQEKSRFILGVGGVASAVLLVMLLGGIYIGFTGMAKTYFTNAGAEIWVGSKGAGYIYGGLSLLPPSLSEEIGAVEGVKRAESLLFVRTMLEIKGKEVLVAIAGYSPEGGMGGPWRVIEGSSNVGRGDVIVDKVFASRQSLKVGGELEIQGRSFKIRGVSEGTNLFISQLLFLHRDDAESLFDMGGMVNYILASTRNPVDDVKARIEERFPDVTVLTREEFAEKSTEIAMESFNSLLTVIVLIGGAVGTTVVGLTVYTLTIERSKEYGVLKAIGAENSQLYTIVLQQSLIVALSGFIVGGLGSAASAELMERLVPQVEVTFDWYVVAGSLALALLMSGLASFFPVRRIGGIDPAIVFKGR